MLRFSLGEKTVSTKFKRIDCAKVAEGLGARGYHVEKPGELKKAVADALQNNKPAVIDCIIDPDEVPPIHRWAKSIGAANARLDYL